MVGVGRIFIYYFNFLVFNLVVVGFLFLFGFFYILFEGFGGLEEWG